MTVSKKLGDVKMHRGDLGLIEVIDKIEIISSGVYAFGIFPHIKILESHYEYQDKISRKII